jgi:monofunctional biosynthetic peptidoglycan transglycosylase
MSWLLDRLPWRRRYRRRLSARQRAVRILAWGSLGLVLLTVLSTLCLRWIDPPTSAFMLQSRLAARAQGREDYRLRHYWVDWRDIAPHAKIAVIAAEDQKFFTHAGFDLDSITDAVYDRVKHGRRRGASTLSQQVAKNLFLWSGKSYLRKGLEAYFTVLVEFFWPKRRVLEVYLNLAQFGDGVFGIEAASVVYFQKSARELTPREAALLAAVLPNPARFRADHPSEYVRERAHWILTQIDSLGGPEYVSARSRAR